MTQFFVYIEKAFQINNSNPNILLILSEHYLYKGEYEKAQNLAIKGLIE